MAKFLIGLVVVLWGAWVAVVVLGVVKFDNPHVAPLSVALAGMLAFFAVLFIYMSAAQDDGMPRSKYRGDSDRNAHNH